MIRRFLGVAAATLLAGLGAAPGAAAGAATVPVGPHERFGGTVNDVSGAGGAAATVRMACFGPTRPGQTGHPLAGQTLGVFVPEILRDPGFGRTGAHGRRIVARFRSAAGTSAPAAVFTGFTVSRPVLLTATRPLPTELVLPCSGSGLAVFAPVPAERDARPAYVRVSFAGQP